MPLILLCFELLTKLGKIILRHAASLVYIALFDAPITAMLCTIYQIRAVCYSKSCIVGIYHLTYTSSSESTASGVKRKDILQAELRICHCDHSAWSKDVVARPSVLLNKWKQ